MTSTPLQPVRWHPPKAPARARRSTSAVPLPPVPLPKVASAFSLASVELWSNFRAMFTAAEADWSHLGIFLRYIFLPYLVGGLIPGIIAGLVAYYASYPIILSYQRGRIHRLKERFENRRKAAEAAREGAGQIDMPGRAAVADLLERAVDQVETM